MHPKFCKYFRQRQDWLASGRLPSDFFKDVSFHVSFHVKFCYSGCCDFSINNPQNTSLVTWLLTWNITFWVKYSIKKIRWMSASKLASSCHNWLLPNSLPNQTSTGTLCRYTAILVYRLCTCILGWWTSSVSYQVTLIM